MRSPAARHPRPAALLALLLAVLALLLASPAPPAGAEDRCFSEHDTDDDRCDPSTTTTAKPTTTTTRKPTTTTTAKPTTTTTQKPTTTTTLRRRRPPSTTTTTNPPTTAAPPAPAPTDPPPPPAGPAPSPSSPGGSSSGGSTTGGATRAETSDPTLPAYAAAPAAAEPNPFLAALDAVGGILPSDKVRSIPGGDTDPVDELRTSLAAARLEEGSANDGVSPVVWGLAGLLGIVVLAAVLRLDRRLARS